MAKVGITFTHYVGPSRRRVIRWIHRPADIEAKAEAITAVGGLFEVEDTSTIEVRIACVHEGKAVAHKQSRIIDRDVTMAVDSVISEAYDILVER